MTVNPDIPQEIIEKIIGCATADEPNFSSTASLVSPIFHQIVLPNKFRSLTFWNRIREGVFVGRDIVPIPYFCKAINAGDAHALSLVPFVQELNLLEWCDEDGYDNDLILEPFEKIINSVLSFRNLRKMQMKGCVTSPAIMEQLGKLVQLRSLHIWNCQDEGYGDMVLYGALSNLQSLRTLECVGNSHCFEHHLACIPMENLRILISHDMAVTKALLTTNPPIQLKMLYLGHNQYDDYPLLWNFLAKATSLTNLFLPNLELPDGITSPIFHFPNLQYLFARVTFAPCFADQPMNRMRIKTKSKPNQAMVEVRQRWQGIVFPHVEHLETDLGRSETESVPKEFWKEFVLNVKTVQRCQ